MPYVPQEIRTQLDSRGPETPGELNYLLSQVVAEYLATKGGESYATYNDVIGALECLKLEVYRRLCSPYEDAKIEANGDVFDRGTDGGFQHPFLKLHSDDRGR